MSLALDTEFVNKIALELCPFMENEPELELLICNRSCVNCRNAARQVIITIESKIGEPHGRD